MKQKTLSIAGLKYAGISMISMSLLTLSIIFFGEYLKTDISFGVIQVKIMASV